MPAGKKILSDFVINPSLFHSFLKSKFVKKKIDGLRADFLVDGLLKLLVVHYCSHLTMIIDGFNVNDDISLNLMILTTFPLLLLAQ